MLIHGSDRRLTRCASSVLIQVAAGLEVKQPARIHVLGHVYGCDDNRHSIRELGPSWIGAEALLHHLRDGD